MKKIFPRLLYLLRSISDLPRRIMNLTAWHKIVWKDHPRDYSKLLEIMEHKFCLQADYWLSVAEEEKARYNLLCQDLAKMVRNEHYLNELIGYFSQRRLEEYLQKHSRHMKKMYRKVSKGIDQNQELNEDEMSMLAMDIASYKHRKAKRLLFKIMYNQLENWQH
jgi:hypothetical protein